MSSLVSAANKKSLPRTASGYFTSSGKAVAVAADAVPLVTVTPLPEAAPPA